MRLSSISHSLNNNDLCGVIVHGVVVVTAFPMKYLMRSASHFNSFLLNGRLRSACYRAITPSTVMFGVLVSSFRPDNSFSLGFLDADSVITSSMWHKVCTLD